MEDRCGWGTGVGGGQEWVGDRRGWGTGLRNLRRSHLQRASFRFYGQQDASQRADDASQGEGTECLDDRPRHQHLKDTRRTMREGDT